MSNQRSIFETQVRSPFPDWAAAVDNLNALAMPEMLAALAGLTESQRKAVSHQAWQLLSAQRNWKANSDRIEFALSVVEDRVLDRKSGRVPQQQVEDATLFLIAQLKPAHSRADRGSYPNADAAAIAALVEILPTTAAVGLEFSGTVYSQGGAFRFTAPVRGEETASEPDVPVPAGAKAVGMYHTHPAGRPGSNTFSPEDMAVAKGIPGVASRAPRMAYLGAPRGPIKKLTPPAFLTGSDKTSGKYSMLGRVETLRP